MRIDLNCDLGESFGIYKIGNDELIMDYVTSVNIACGMHAGDPDIMMKTIKLAIEKGVSIGAHPGYPDLKGFGRRELDLTKDELKNTVLYQVGALKAMVEACGGKLQHVKPHGALYNLAAKDEQVAYTIVEAVKLIDKNLVIMGLAESAMLKACKKLNMRMSNELFGDRRYTPDLKLQSRREFGSVLELDDSISQCYDMVMHNRVIDCTGTVRSLNGETICIHGDNIKGVELAMKLRQIFKENNIEVKAINEN